MRKERPVQGAGGTNTKHAYRPWAVRLDAVGADSVVLEMDQEGGGEQANFTSGSRWGGVRWGGEGWDGKHGVFQQLTANG